MKDYDIQQVEATMILVGVIGAIMLIAGILILAGIDWFQKTYGQDDLCSNATSYEECDAMEDEPGYCQGNLTAMDREFCNE